MIELEPIAKDRRRTREEIAREFGTALPGILGALLDIYVHGLKMLPNVQLAEMPRMVDFAKWGVAVEGAFAEPGTFLNAYNASIRKAAETLLEGDPVEMMLGVRLRNAKDHTWTGTASDLLVALNGTALDYRSDHWGRQWPKNAKALGLWIARMATALRQRGIEVIKERGADSRIISFRAAPQQYGNPLVISS